MGSEFVVPAIKRISILQSRHQVSVNSTVFAETTSDQVSIPGTSHEDEALKELLKQKLAKFPRGQNWSVFMYDLSEGATVNINSDKLFASASLYKLFLLESLETKLPFDRWAYTWTPDGTNVQDCVYEMLRASDSACAESIGSYIGWDFIDQLNQKHGFKNTKVSASEGRESSASDIGELLIRLKKGQTLSDKARRFVFDALYQQFNKEGISAGCNNDCRTADKIGEMSGITHDAGIVTHGSRSYVLVIMSEGGTLKQVAEITKAIESR